MVVELNGVDIDEGKLIEDELDEDGLKVGFDEDPTCLVEDMEIARIPPTKGGRPQSLRECLGV